MLTPSQILSTRTKFDGASQKHAFSTSLAQVACLPLSTSTAMAPRVFTEKSTFSQKNTTCFHTNSYSHFRPSSPSSSFPSSSPNHLRASSAASSLIQSSAARLHYAAAYPTPMEAYTPSDTSSKSLSLHAPASVTLPSGCHRPKSLPPARSLRISAGGSTKLHYQSTRHVFGSGARGVSSSTLETPATSLSCPSPSPSRLSRHFSTGKVVLTPPLRNPSLPAAPPSLAPPTPAAASAPSPTAAHAPVTATACVSPAIILHSKPYGLFGPLPKSLLREGHKQRIAGVDVLRLSDSTIIPRIENSSLQQMLQSDPSIFATLEAALTECVSFLYNEGIKPFAGEIAHQMRKRIEGGSWLPSEVVALAVAAKDVYPRVERRVKGEDGWVVLLKKELHPPNFDGFVDTRAREDCYSPEQWREFNRYFIEKMRIHSTDPGGNATAAAVATQFTEGRYALAERLRAEIPMFQSMKLAHLIRMVQLASWKKLLTYRDKALVPVAACPVTAKEFAQRNCMNLRGSDKSAAALASIEQLLRALSCIVDPEPTGIFLAQLKDLVRWTTYERLDCMVLGHTKLQDLLMSEPFIRFYRLYTPEGNEHCTYVQSKKFPLPWGAVLHTKCSMLWDPEACPMDPTSEQQYFSLSDAGCCWQYKALVPLYAQQRNSACGSICALSRETKNGESSANRTAPGGTAKRRIPSLVNCVREPPGSGCEDGSTSARVVSAGGAKLTATASLRSTSEGTSAAGAGEDSATGEEKRQKVQKGEVVYSIFHWVERDIVKLLDEECFGTTPVRETGLMRRALQNESKSAGDAVASVLLQSNGSPSSEKGLHKQQNFSSVKCRDEVVAEVTHALGYTSEHGGNTMVKAPAVPWYPSAFLEACCGNEESISDLSEDGLFEESTPAASAALLHAASASRSSPCCCSADRRDDMPVKSLAHGKKNGHFAHLTMGGNVGGEESFSSLCPAAAAAMPPSATVTEPCWHESKFKMRRIIKQSPNTGADTYGGVGCFLSASCINSSPYKREEETMRTPSTSSDGALHVSPPLLRVSAVSELTSSSEIGISDLQPRNLFHAEKTRQTK